MHTCKQDIDGGAPAAPVGGDVHLLAVATCTFCGKEVNPRSRLTYTRVIGWHRPGKAGGSDITDRKLLDEYAHPQCLDRERWGIHASQETLV